MRRTWEAAQERIPPLSVSSGQFKPNMAMLLAYETDTGKEEHQVNITAAEAENHLLAERISFLEAELAKHRPDTDTPKGIIRQAGWSLVRYGKYWKCFRKVGGKAFGIHLGKTPDADNALKKIAEREARKDFQEALIRKGEKTW